MRWRLGSIRVNAGVLQAPEWAAFVLTEGHSRLRTVTLGPRSGLLAVVEGGLEPGERVIVYPGDAMRDGVRINASQPGRRDKG